MKKSIFLLILLVMSRSVLPAKTIELTTGNYPSVDLAQGDVLVVTGSVKVTNLNISGHSTITVNTGSYLEISSSFHLNGNVTVHNHGEIRSNNFEAQNGGNKFYNYGSYKANVGQINECSSVIDNHGTIQFNSFQANCGSVIIRECAKFETKHLDVNKEKFFSGTGFLLVTQTGNFNQVIGHPGLHFHSVPFVNPDKTVGLKLVPSNHNCTSLPIIWSSVKFTNNEVSFDVSDPDQIEYVEIEISRDGRTWEKVKRVTGINEHNKIKFN